HLRPTPFPYTTLFRSQDPLRQAVCGSADGQPGRKPRRSDQTLQESSDLKSEQPAGPANDGAPEPQSPTLTRCVSIFRLSLSRFRSEEHTSELQSLRHL